MLRTRILVGALLIVGLMSVGTFTTNGTGVAPAKQWATVTFDQPLRFGGQMLIGPYLIVHDDAQMAQGKPCTTIYRFDPKRGPQERVATFMCVPSNRPLATRLTLAIRRSPDFSTPMLQGYQFAGDTEEHDVPRNFR